MSPTEMSRTEMDVLKQEAERAQAYGRGPDSLVAVPADKLLWLLVQAREHQGYVTLETQLYDEETEQTINELEEENQKLRDRLIAETE